MSIEHHPDDLMLAGFAAGTLDHGQHVAIATHLAACPKCRDFVRVLEQTGGAMLSRLPPAPMSSTAFEHIQSRLTEPMSPAPIALSPASVSESEIPGLPEFVRRYRFGKWIWVAPSVHMRPILLPHPSDTRVFLLRSGSGTKMLEHSHSGVEMTCVLSGAFRHEGGRFGPGDFDFGDDTVDHQPVVDDGQECICLVAMQGELRLNGLVGRLIQPFLRL
ncbi:MAG: cupin domain-containing protein [Pseudorhodoplanes sp.]|nr:cupin domain-containing protein [Pseudorhodoplanes sp.]